MLNKTWIFNDEPNAMALTTKYIIEKKIPILFVSHDEDDNMWQFHNGTDVNMDDAILVSLREIVDCDSSVTELADLPLGWIAFRETNQGLWQRKNE